MSCYLTYPILGSESVPENIAIKVSELTTTYASVPPYTSTQYSPGDLINIDSSCGSFYHLIMVLPDLV